MIPAMDDEKSRAAQWPAPPRRSIVELIADGVLDAELAALAWLLIEARVPIVVGALARGAGKSTLLEALLDFLPASVRRIDLAGQAEDFAWLPEAAALGWPPTGPTAVSSPPVTPRHRVHRRRRAVRAPAGLHLGSGRADPGPGGHDRLRDRRDDPCRSPRGGPRRPPRTAGRPDRRRAVVPRTGLIVRAGASRMAPSGGASLPPTTPAPSAAMSTATSSACRPPCSPPGTTTRTSWSTSPGA